HPARRWRGRRESSCLSFSSFLVPRKTSGRVVATRPSQPRPLASRVATQLILIEDHADSGTRRQEHLEILKAQRLRHEVVGEDLRAEMFAAPAKFAQAS